MAHAVGSVPIDLTSLDADCAILPTSKYLCAGPGNIGAFWINPRYRGVNPGLRGWFGTDRNVLTNQIPDFTPSPDALKRFQISGCDPISLAKVDAALSYFVDNDYN